MFFPLSKILWAVVAPANLLFLMLFLAVLLGMRWRKAGQGMLMIVFFLYCIFGLLPVGPDLLHYLERQYTRPVSMPAHVDGILVLGGAVETRASAVSGLPEFNDGAERVHNALALSRRYPNALLVFSGGSGLLIDRERKESQDISAFLKSIGFSEDSVLYEDESRNTYENFLYTKSMVLPQPGETWLLVTSAFHMPRSMAIARKLGWDVLPYPVDYRGPGRYLLWPKRFYILDHLNQAELALREMIGIVAYRKTGKI